jgi:acetaldehyde dehydrogenase (acetylating)
MLSEELLVRDGKINAAIVGPGNIGTDLMYKIIHRSEHIRLSLMCGIYENSEGLKRAKEFGVETSAQGIRDLLSRNDIDIVFDATTANAHQTHAPLFREAGIFAVDLTPAAVGPYCIPVINLHEHLEINTDNVNLITCGGQATIPIVKAVSRIVKVDYAEIVAVIASKSAGPGTRQSIDEFTQTTAKGIVELGKAKRGKAIILLNPAIPPMTMNNTIYMRVSDWDEKLINDSVERMVAEVQSYVPGYRLKIPPTFDGDRIVVMVEVEGSGDFLPSYSGNLDIETCAALAIGERKAAYMLDTNLDNGGFGHASSN